MFVYVSKFAGNLNQIKLSEGAGFAFFSEEEIKELKVIPQDLEVIEFYFEK